MKKPLPFILALLVGCFSGAAHTSGQTQTEEPASTSNSSSASDSAESADLAITAYVTARELSFETVPNTSVEFTGSHQRDTLWDAERQNLPRPVQPGVTYRDIGIRLKITSVFADIDRIVAEALGEVPASSGDASPDGNAPPESAPQSPVPSTQTPSQPEGGTPQ